MPHRKVRVLLLQARRSDDPMKSHEHRCFVVRTGLLEERLESHDLTEGPPTLAQVRSYDALMVGGSGDFYISKGNLPGFDRFIDLMREIAEIGHPTFAACFGYQAMVHALGGEIVHDPDRTEVGTYELRLTEAASDDPIFGLLPSRFLAQQGHKDRAARYPDGVPNFAESELSPFQAFRLPNRPVWGAQFHPELDRETNLDRFHNYLESYASYMTPQERAEAMRGFRDSPEASALLLRFLQVVFG